MSGTFKFIHAADIHLGSYLNINGRPKEEVRDLCKVAVYDAFERICHSAILYKVDFILLCGDVYDSYLRSVRSNKFFTEQCIRLGEKNINIYVIYGNHDAIKGKEELFELPSNVFIFSSDMVESFQVYKEGQVVAKVVGKSYKQRCEKEKIYEKYLVDDEVFNIAMLHTALEDYDKNYIPCSLEELKKIPNIDYWALGHIHKGSVLCHEKPIIAYPGIPQGRDMGEPDVGGVFLVQVCNKEVSHMEFLPIATVIYKRLEISIAQEDKIENYSDLMQLILERVNRLRDEVAQVSSGIKDFNEGKLSMKARGLLKAETANEHSYVEEVVSHEFKGQILQLVISGRTELHSKIAHMKDEDYKQFIQSINEELSTENYFLWIDSINFRTTPLMQDFESLKLQNSIFQELEEVIQLYREDDNYKNEFVKNFGLIWKKQIYTENMEEDRFHFDEEVIEDIMLQAKELVIEKLAEALEIM